LKKAPSLWEPKSSSGNRFVTLKKARPEPAAGRIRWRSQAISSVVAWEDIGFSRIRIRSRGLDLVRHRSSDLSLGMNSSSCCVSGNLPFLYDGRNCCIRRSLPN
ncbi:unnamed protein product, partial [Musa acuminata subsp. burmannicoides]